MTPLNILIFEPYPFNRIAGNLRTQSNIIKFVDKEKFHLIFLSPFETGFTKKLESEGVDTVILEAPARVNRYGGKNLNDGSFGRFKTVISLFRYNLRLRKVLRQKNIDIIYCNSIRGVLTICLSALLTRVPILWYIKGELQNTILDTIGFFLSRKILYFCESNKNDKYPLLTGIFRKKIGILKIGIDPDVVANIEQTDKSNLAKEFSIDGQTINLVYTGQLYRPKGIHYLLEAITLVKDEFPNIQLYTVGDHIIEEYKDYFNDLKNIIEQHGMSEHIIFTGWRPDALQIVALMDILVHPSLSEGFGRAVLEGMALGKPVIASKVGGLRELISDGENGFLVDAGNPSQIAEKLRLLLASKELREKLGKEARKTVYSEYLIQDKIGQMELIWSEMVANN